MRIFSEESARFRRISFGPSGNQGDIPPVGTRRTIPVHGQLEQQVAAPVAIFDPGNERPPGGIGPGIACINPVPGEVSQADTRDAAS